MTNITINSSKEVFSQIKTLLINARNHVVQSVNTTMVYTYFEIGRIIVENEQGGKERAEYNKQTLKRLSEQLIAEFGKGFSVTNLKQMRTFFLAYQKGQTLSDKSQKNRARESDLTLPILRPYFLFLTKLSKNQHKT